MKVNSSDFENTTYMQTKTNVELAEIETSTSQDFPFS
ncbi:unnamed protein product, partial [Amoebophrya sp. A25]|eukprot:GSA25T00007285001.1